MAGEVDRPGLTPARVAAGGALLAALAAVIYWPCLQGGWLWDDREDIPDNLFLRVPGGLQKLWQGKAGFDYYPLKSTVQWLEWRWWGNHTLGYHGVNVGLHLLSAILVWRLLTRLGLRVGWSWAGAALFLVHPAGVQAVAWIAELKDALSLPLLLLSALAFLAFARSGRWGWAVLSLAGYGAALLAKTSVVPFPAALGLYAALQPPDTRRRLWLAIIPFLAAAVIMAVVTCVLQQSRSIGSEDLGVGALGFRTALSVETFGFYVRHTLIPWPIQPLYGRWNVEAGAPLLRGLGSLLLMAWLLSVGWRRRGEPYGQAALLGGAWYVLFLMPVLGFVAISYFRLSWVMDHFTYVSLVGVAGLAAAAAQAGAARARALVFLACAAVVCLFAAISRGYAGAYAGEEALWSYAAARDRSVWMPQSNLGAIRLDQGRYAEAEALLRGALALQPRATESHRNLGVVLDRQGRVPEAIAEAKVALTLRPDYALAEDDLGTYLGQQRQFAAAQTHFERAARLNPNDAALHNKYGFVLFQLKRLGDAAAQFQQAAALAPANGEYQLNAGAALAEVRRFREAIPHLEAAERLLPNDARPRKNLVLVRQALARSPAKSAP